MRRASLLFPLPFAAAIGHASSANAQSGPIEQSVTDILEKIKNGTRRERVIATMELGKIGPFAAKAAVPLLIDGMARIIQKSIPGRVAPQ